MSIPILNLFLMPAAVVGAAIFLHERPSGLPAGTAVRETPLEASA